MAAGLNSAGLEAPRGATSVEGLSVPSARSKRRLGHLAKITARAPLAQRLISYRWSPGLKSILSFVSLAPFCLRWFEECVARPRAGCAQPGLLRVPAIIIDTNYRQFYSLCVNLTHKGDCRGDLRMCRRAPKRSRSWPTCGDAHCLPLMVCGGRRQSDEEVQDVLCVRSTARPGIRRAVFDSKRGELEMAAKGRRPDPPEVKIEKAWKRRLDLAKRRMKAHDAKSPRSRRRAWGTDYFASKRRVVFPQNPEQLAISIGWAIGLHRCIDCATMPLRLPRQIVFSAEI